MVWISLRHQSLLGLSGVYVEAAWPPGPLDLITLRTHRFRRAG